MQILSLDTGNSNSTIALLENNQMEFEIDGRLITERWSRPLPGDLMLALEELYSLGETAAKWNGHIDNSFLPIYESKFPANYKEMPAYKESVHAALFHCQANQTANATEAAQIQLTNLVQSKLGTEFKIQSTAAIKDCIFVNGTPIDKFLAYNENSISFRFLLNSSSE